MVSDDCVHVTLDKFMLPLLSIGFLLVLFSLGVLQHMYPAAGLSSPSSYGYPLWLEIAVAAVLTTVLHEGIHILFMKKLGSGKTSIRPFMFKRYIPLGVSVGFTNYLSVKRWSIVAIAPLIILSPVSLVASGLETPVTNILKFVFVFNTSGSAGDLILLAITLSAGLDANVKDEGEALAICNGRPRLAAILFLEYAATTILSFLALGFLAITMASLLGKNIYVGPLELARFEASQNQVSASTGPGVIVVAIILSLLYIVISGTRRARKTLESMQK
ncbi:MAG: DUF3267 domain-containing protein [Infirmifilum sp.]|uniref:DUF3267 domain-containing protein n=1 Tax=Infirmifilum TaxID=2856573 RepID=UPI003C78B962